MVAAKAKKNSCNYQATKHFRTGSSSTVNECQVNFGFLPVKSQILIRTASFFAEVYRVVNSMCTLFANDARRQLHNILMQSGTNIKTERICVMLFVLNF